MAGLAEAKKESLLKELPLQFSQFVWGRYSKQHRRAIDQLRRFPLRAPLLSANLGRREKAKRQSALICGETSYSIHLLKISDPFVPPNPNELESAIFSGAFRATLGT